VVVLALAGTTPLALAAGADGSGSASSAGTSSKGGWISNVSGSPSVTNHFSVVDTTGHADSRPGTALNDAGEGVTAWQDRITGYVMVSQIEPGDGWSTPHALAPGAHPAVAIDAAGDVTVAWVDSHGNVDYAHNAAGSTGFVDGQISGSGNPEGASSPQVAMDSGGNAWLLWTVASGPFGLLHPVYAAYLPAATLAGGGPPTWTGRLESPAGPGYSASLATNPSGSAIVAVFPAADDSAIGIAYANSGSGSFSNPVREVTNPGPGGMQSPSIALNDAGDAVLAWDECSAAFGTLCVPGAGARLELASATASELANRATTVFGSPQTVALGTPASQYHPRVAVNDDEVAVAWNDLGQTHPSTQFSADAAAEPLADLSGGTAGWQQLVVGDSDTTEAAPYTGPRIAIDAGSDVTVAWQGADSGSGEGTVNAITATDCATTCASTSTLALDSQASTAARLSLVAAPNGDELLSWTSYAPSGGALPTVVAGAYDPGPDLTGTQIPADATVGTAASFSVQSSDDWSALDGPVVTHWDFGDGSGATGTNGGHTYTAAGTYTVSVTASTSAASSTLSRQIVVSPAAVSTPGPTVATAPLSGVAAWGSHTAAGSVSADLTVPAISCAGNTTALSGQALGIRFWGSRLSATSATALADFAGVDVECRGASSLYEPSFTISDVNTGSTNSQDAKLTVSPGDLLQLSISDSPTGASLSITDLSTPNQAPATISGPSLAPDAGWQVGAFPIPGVAGPYATVPTAFTNVAANGAGIGTLPNLQSSSWGSASVSEVGRTNNQLSVVYASVPQAPRGGSLAAPARGTVLYRRPGTHRWTRLTRNTPLPANTQVDATGGTVQLSNPEPHGQHQSVTTWGGEFSASSDSKGLTTIRVVGFWSGVAAGGARAAGARAGLASAHKRTKTVHGNLWAKGHGRFTTKGNYGAAAVLGTEWLTRNLRRGTLFQVSRNHYDHNDRIRVTVDYPHRHTVVLRQGQSVLAPAPTPKVKRRAAPRQPVGPAPVAFTIVGVKRVNGRYNVDAPGYYQLTMLSRSRPYYVDAAVAPNQPSGGGAWFYRDGSSGGEPQWEIHFEIKQSLDVFQLWNIGIRLGDKLYVVPLRLK
jgi:PKD repeat protein